eukprot:CAMPEP_0119005032 /NCGR_PEP_ID=MMETSP1176-20130426/1490_1 /TAXON_ID=265551 /ORGANISM="Synedropsis recta cf, Strain CCMP1620" /LENGTH=320 /DNA_ID=CAMNT_0006956797 /DNA_START=46 /DNA_END=1008 /DNA_ORIENTATION=-
MSLAPEKKSGSSFGGEYFVVQKSGLSQAQAISAYLGGSCFQTIMDNPITAYRQLVQQYAKDLQGKPVDPAIARDEARAIFRTAPVSASLSGVGPRLIGVGFKRIPKFGILLGISFFLGEGESPGMVAATGASILSAPFINPIRMIEKQQRAYFKQTGAVKPIWDIVKESAAQRFAPLFRGTIPLMGHSFASAILGLVGQPRLQKYIQKEVGDRTGLGRSVTGLFASAVVSPIYVFVTNPLSRLEVIMQTSSIQGKPITVMEAVGEVMRDSAKFGLRGVFRGQGVGITKAVISLTLFHEGRMYIQDLFKEHNIKKGYFTPE